MDECINNNAVPMTGRLVVYRKPLPQYACGVSSDASSGSSDLGFAKAEMRNTADVMENNDSMLMYSKMAADTASPFASSKLLAHASRSGVLKNECEPNLLEHRTGIHRLSCRDGVLVNYVGKQMPTPGVIWDITIPPDPIAIARQMVETRLERTRQTHCKTARLGWRAEVIVYAKLGYWESSSLPRPVLEDPQFTNAEVASQFSSTSFGRRGLKVGLLSGQSMNTVKRTLRKLSDLDRFYRCLQNDEVTFEELNLAVYVCQFGINLGLRRSTKTYEENYYRPVRVGIANMTTSDVSTLNRTLNLHSRRTSKVYFPSTMKRGLDPVTLSGLNEFHTLDKYRLDEHFLPGNGTSGWNDTEGLLVDTSGRLSFSSEVSKLTSYEDAVEIVDLSLGVADESKELVAIGRECKEPMEANVDTVEQCITNKNKVDCGEVSSSGNTLLGVQGPILRESHRDQSSPVTSHVLRFTRHSVGSRDNIRRKSIQLRILTPRRPLSTIALSQRLSRDAVKRGREFVTVSKKIRTSKVGTESHSQWPTQRLHQPSTMGWPNKVHIPNLVGSTPMPLLVRAMIETLTQKATRSKDQTQTCDLTMRRICEFTMKRNPMVARILRDQTVNILEICERQFDIKSLDCIPDSKRSHGSEIGRFLLPEVPHSKAPSPLQDTRVHMPGFVGTPRTTSIGKRRHLTPKHVKRIPSATAQSAVDKSDSVSSTGTSVINVVDEMDFQHLSDNVISSVDDLLFSPSAIPNNTLGSATEVEVKPKAKGKSHAFLVPRMPPKAPSLLHAVSQELVGIAPFALELFTQTLRRVIPEERWQYERNSLNILAALERLGGDLLVYRHSSGHVVRFKVMSILAASADNRVLRRQLQFTAPLHGNWLDQLLRTLSSDRSTCRLEAALTLSKLATEPKLMKQLIEDTKHSVVAEIFASLLRSADYHPQSWPECYLALAFFLHYNQCQVIHDTLIDRGIQYGLEQCGPCWLRLLSHVYTYWRPTVLAALSINEKRISSLLDTALRNPLTKKVARETLAAISEHHTIDCNLFSLWRSGSQGQTQDGCGSPRTKRYE